MTLYTIFALHIMQYMDRNQRFCFYMRIFFKLYILLATYSFSLRRAQIIYTTSINFISRILIRHIHLEKMHRHAILGCVGIHSRRIRASTSYDIARYRLHRTSPLCYLERIVFKNACDAIRTKQQAGGKDGSISLDYLNKTG